MTTLFHIGFRKTGTSTLQRHFFPTLEGWAYLGLGSPLLDEFRPLVNSLLFDEDADYRATELRALIDRERRGRAGIVVSREHLSTFHRLGHVAPRVHDLEPEAKILVCVRNHRTILPSAYGQNVKAGGTLRFDEWAERVLSERLFHYDVVVQRYQELFGPERVMVSPFELLVSDRVAFLDGVYSFMTGGDASPREWPATPPENVAVSQVMLPVLRRVNRVTKPFRYLHSRKVRLRAAQFVDRLLFSRSSRAFPQRDVEVVERLLPRYAESNARLQELTGLDLRDFGYALP
jgi:hypothetical protein